MSKVVFITGGSSGIGKAIGIQLTNRGYVVYGTSRNPDAAAKEHPFPLVTMTVNDAQSVQQAIQNVYDKEGRIDILINNAGVGITGAVEETPDEEIQQAFDTNLYGPIRAMKAVMPIMRSQQQGLIINVTSIAGFMGLPYRTIYSATKSALAIITEGMRMEAKQFGIQITNVAPGDFATNIASGRYHAPLLDDSPYKKDYQNTLEMMNGHVDSGGDPMEVAKLVVRIVEKRHPKVHYKVGAFLQKFSVVLKNILPSKVYERMLMNHYKLK